MSEFFLCEIENIEKSGVEIKVTGTKLKKDDDDCIRTVRTVCFDFSEHDKRFIDEIVQLKQRIAELESKETEKPTKCTAVIVAKEINGQTYVTLDDFMSVVNDLQAEIGT